MVECDADVSTTDIWWENEQCFRGTREVRFIRLEELKVENHYWEVPQSNPSFARELKRLVHALIF